MYEVTYDRAKNRIYIKLEGTMSLDEADGYNEAVKKAADQAQPGFTICIDGAKAAPFSPEVDAKCAESRNYLVKKGVKDTATVVDSAILKMHVARTLKEIGGNVFGSKEEADKYLDSL
jgi:hypothetical protein